MTSWFRFIKNSKLLKDETIIDESDKTRTKKIFAAIDKLCYNHDLSHPAWLESNINEFKRTSKTRFRKDNFIDEIEFDFLEMIVLEEDIPN